MNTTIILEEKECPTCHLLYWISKAHNDRLRKSKNTFYCPNGHTASYPGKTDEQNYLEEKRKAERYIRYYEEKAERVNQLNNIIRTQKGVITKLKKKGKK